MPPSVLESNDLATLSLAQGTAAPRQTTLNAPVIVSGANGLRTTCTDALCLEIAATGLLSADTKLVSTSVIGSSIAGAVLPSITLSPVAIQVPSGAASETDLPSNAVSLVLPDSHSNKPGDHLTASFIAVIIIGSKLDAADCCFLRNRWFAFEGYKPPVCHVGIGSFYNEAVLSSLIQSHTASSFLPAISSVLSEVYAQGSGSVPTAGEASPLPPAQTAGPQDAPPSSGSAAEEMQFRWIVSRNSLASYLADLSSLLQKGIELGWFCRWSGYFSDYGRRFWRHYGYQSLM